MQEVISFELIGFDYEHATRVEEIKRNLTYLFATPAGSCAGDRSYGISRRLVGLPMNVAENKLALEILEKVETYEPRVKVLDLQMEPDGPSGSLKAFAKIGPADDYEEEEPEEPDDDEETEEE